MSSRLFPAGVPVLLAALLLAGCSGNVYDEYAGTERLPSCSIEDSPFADLPFEEWADTYHAAVSKVVAADIDDLSGARCAEGDGKLPPPTPELTEMARTLKPWLISRARLNALSQTDVGAVLLEYLRTYECAMLEYRTFIYNKITAESASIEATQGPTASGVVETRIQYNELRQKRDEKISEELNISRQAMARTLALLGKMGRLRPVLSDVNCFLAAAPDLRNQFGLAAEIGSCLARTRDAQGSIRDFPDFKF